MYNPFGSSQYPPGWGGPPHNLPGRPPFHLGDYGPHPFTINLREAALRNRNFRTALWTGEHLQLTVMSLNVGEDIGLEIHADVDQYIRIEQGQALVMMGDNVNHLNFRRMVSNNDVILVPAGTWHNVVNTGPSPLKLSVIYAPPEHPRGTVHRTKQEAGHHYGKY